MSQLDQLLAEFEVSNAKEARALRAILDNTPTLKARFQQAAAGGQLSSLGAHKLPGGGSYDPADGEMRVPMGYLSAAKTDDVKDNPSNAARIVLDHEIAHALNKADIEKTNEVFANRISQIAAGPSPHDYTDALRERGAVQRTREAKDEIAGINSLVDFVRTSKPDAALKDLYDASREMRSYIDRKGLFNTTHVAKDGLTFGPDLKIAETPANVEAMGKLFYDDRKYPQGYGAVALEAIAKAEAKAQAANPTQPAPIVQADLASLGIDASKVPAGWLPAGFTDTSAKERLPDSRVETPNPADEALTNKIRNGVVGLEQGLGKSWDDSSERLTAGLTLLAKRSGFSERDQLAVMFNNPTESRRGGELVFLHRTGPDASNNPAANRAHMTTADALAEPAQARYQQAVDTPTKAQAQSQPQQPQANLEVTQTASHSHSQSQLAVQTMQR